MPNDAPPAPLHMKDVIEGAGLSDRAYLKDFLDKPADKDTLTAIVKKLDGAESLIGRKIGIPADDAKDDEVEKFYRSLAPAKPEDYDFKPREGADPEMMNTVRDAFYSAGLSKRQVGKFLEKFLPVLEAKGKAAAAEQAKLDQEFEEITKAAFGGQNAAVLERVKGAISEHAPDSLKSHVASLDNKSLALMAGVIDAIMRKYMSEDQLNNKGPKGGGDTEGLREKGRQLMATKEYNDPFHPNHAKVKAEVDALYAQIGGGVKK